jgi:hypothetical protein
LGLLGANATVVRGRSDKLARLVVAMYLRRLRGCMARLKSEKENQVLEESVEREGEQAQKLERLHDEIAAMEDQLHREGFTEPHIADEVQKIAANKDALMRKAIGRWLAYEGDKEDVIMAVEKWKKQAAEQRETRGKLQKLCNLVEQFPLHKGLSRWRKYNVKAKEAFKGWPKETLIDE